MKIIEKFSYSGKYRKVYLPLISGFLDDDYKIIPVKKRVAYTNDITDIGLFLFTDRAIAVDFAELVSDYFLNSVKNCKTGQRFWPEFRLLLAKAYNYKGLENIHKSRTYLDKAMFDLDSRKVKNRKTKAKKGEQRASDSDLFYPGG